MKKETIRSIDVVLGSVICWLLTGLRRVRDLFPPRHRGPPRRIVFLKLIEQGATVIAAPALIRAAQRVGRVNLFFCVFAENRPILDLLDLVPPDNVLPMRHGNLLEFNAFNHRFSPCTNNRCMQEIPVEAVQDVVNRCRRERAAPLEETA